MSTRILFRLFLLAGLVAPFCAFALGIGSLQVRSALNQNFDADIPLIVNNPAELLGLTAQIPRQDEFDRLGIERLNLMSNLRFTVQTPPGGPNFIKVTSVRPVREPNFDLLVEVIWPGGRLLRTFPVQLDPALYTNRREPPPPLQPDEAPLIEAPPVAATDEPAAPGLPPAPPVSFEGASFYGPVIPGQTLSGIVNQVRPSDAISIPDMMAILVAGNPEAFINGNPNRLRAGAMLKVPTPQALGVEGAPSTPESAADVATVTSPIDSTSATTRPLAPASQPAAPVMPLEPPVSPAPETATSPESLTPPVSQQPSEITALPDEQPATLSADQASPETAEAPSVIALTPIAPQEILPQAVMPQEEATPMAETAETAESEPQPTPEVAVVPPVAAPEIPAPVVASPAPPLPPEETSASWLSNPVLWIAILLILLAIAGILAAPFLRRPARKKATAVELQQEEPVPTPVGATDETAVASTQVQLRKPRPQQPGPPGSTAAIAAAALAPSIGAGSRATSASPPKPIDELLRDIDFGLGNEPPKPATEGKGKGPAPRLPDAEPQTASVTQTPNLPVTPSLAGSGVPAPVPIPVPVPEQRSPALKSNSEQPPASRPEKPAFESLSELPSGLKLESLDFDLGDLGQSTARGQAPELPPLELKSAESSKTPNWEPLNFDLDKLEPSTQSDPAQEQERELPKPGKASDLRFEFSDVSQDQEKTGAREDLQRLDEELVSFGDVDLGKMELDSPSGALDPGADYVETKLDLASAYLDMGDQMGARGLLEDVLREGDAVQKQRAEGMLKKLD